MGLFGVLSRCWYFVRWSETRLQCSFRMDIVYKILKTDSRQYCSTVGMNDYPTLPIADSTRSKKIMKTYNMYWKKYSCFFCLRNSRNRERESLRENNWKKQQDLNKVITCTLSQNHRSKDYVAIGKFDESQTRFIRFSPYRFSSVFKRLQRGLPSGSEKGWTELKRKMSLKYGGRERRNKQFCHRCFSKFELEICDPDVIQLNEIGFSDPKKHVAMAVSCL